MEDKQITIRDKLGQGVTFKISRFKEQIKKTQPHKHQEYHELIFLAEGEGFHCIESEMYIVAPPEFYFLKPGQLHYWQFTSIPKGYVILFNYNEFDPVKENVLLELVIKLGDTSNLKMTLDNYPTQLLEALYDEHGLSTIYSKEIQHGLLIALLGKLLQVKEETPATSIQASTLYERFMRLLIKECPRLHKVNQFANLLHTTPQNLNSICRKQTGKNANEIISTQLVLEAKRYILHTDHTIGEIAEILSFSDTSNFIKFFKKHTACTPLQFREKHFQKYHIS